MSKSKTGKAGTGGTEAKGIKLPSPRLAKAEWFAAVKALPFIADAYADGDGFWVILKDGYHWEMPGQHTVHEDTLGTLKAAMKLVAVDEPGTDPVTGQKAEPAEDKAKTAFPGYATDLNPVPEPEAKAEPAKANPRSMRRDAARKAAEEFAKAAEAKAEPAKAPKVIRLELTTRQREVLQEDAKDAGLKADVEKGKQVTVTAGVVKDLQMLATRDGDVVRQRVYQGLLARTRLFIDEHGITAKAKGA